MALVYNTKGEYVEVWDNRERNMDHLRDCPHIWDNCSHDVFYKNGRVNAIVESESYDCPYEIMDIVIAGHQVCMIAKNRVIIHGKRGLDPKCYLCPDEFEVIDCRNDYHPPYCVIISNGKCYKLEDDVVTIMREYAVQHDRFSLLWENGELFEVPADGVNQIELGNVNLYYRDVSTTYTYITNRKGLVSCKLINAKTIVDVEMNYNAIVIRTEDGTCWVGGRCGNRLIQYEGTLYPPTYVKSARKNIISG